MGIQTHLISNGISFSLTHFEPTDEMGLNPHVSEVSL